MTETSKRKLKLLFISSDKFPPFRVDVSIFFGKEVAANDHPEQKSLFQKAKLASASLMRKMHLPKQSSTC